MSFSSRNKYLVKNTTIFAIGNIGTKLINFFMVPLYTYALTQEEYGTIDMFVSICIILVSFVMCNIGESVRRYLLDYEADEVGIQSVEIFWMILGFMLSLLIYIIFKLIDPISKYALEIALYTYTNAFVITSMDYLRGKEKLKIYALCSLYQTFCIAILNFIFLIKFHFGIKGYLWANIVAYLTSGIISFIAGKQIRTIKKTKIKKELFKEMSLYSLTLVPNSIMWWITNSSDRLMVTYFISAAANGVYSISYKLPTLVSVFNTIFMQAWQYSAIKESESLDKIEYNNKMFEIYIVAVSIIGGGLLLINKPFLALYVSNDFKEAWKYSPFLIVGYMFSTLGTFIGTSYYVEKDMKGNLFSSIVGAVCNIILNIILIPLCGIMGAAIATCCSYIIVMIYRLLDTHKYLPLKIISPLTIKVILIIFGMLVFSYLESWVGSLFLGIGFVLIIFITYKWWNKIIKGLLKTEKSEVTI